MVRDAFMATMKDPEFLADTKNLKLDVEPEDGAKLEALSADLRDAEEARRSGR